MEIVFYILYFIIFDLNFTIPFETDCNKNEFVANVNEQNDCISHWP